MQMFAKQWAAQYNLFEVRWWGTRITHTVYSEYSHGVLGVRTGQQWTAQCSLFEVHALYIAPAPARRIGAQRKAGEYSHCGAQGESRAGAGCSR